MAVGEALVSFLDEKGRPSVTQRVFVLPPGSQIGPITPQQRQQLMQTSLVAGVYEAVVDRESAYEKLKGRAVATPPAASSAGSASPLPRNAPGPGTATDAAPSPAPGQAPAETSWWKDVADGLTRGSGRKDSVLETVAKSAARSIGSTVGREIIRGVLGSLLGGSTGRRR
jgi:uncharacterized protein